MALDMGAEVEIQFSVTQHLTWKGTVGKVRSDLGLNDSQVEEVLWGYADGVLSEDSILGKLVAGATSDDIEMDVSSVDGPDEDEEDEDVF